MSEEGELEQESRTGTGHLGMKDGPFIGHVETGDGPVQAATRRTKYLCSLRFQTRLLDKRGMYAMTTPCKCG